METEYHKGKLPARLLSVSEVALFLSVHPSTVRRWLKGGLLKSYTIGLGNTVRFKQEDVLSGLRESQGETGNGVLLNRDLVKGRLKIIGDEVS